MSPVIQNFSQDAPPNPGTPLQELDGNLHVKLHQYANVHSLSYTVDSEFIYERW